MVGLDDRDRWDAYVLSSQHSVAWQLWEWSVVVGCQYGLQFHPLATVEGARIKGILPLYSISAGRGISQLMSVPHAVAGGIAADSEDAEASLLSGAVSLAKDLGARSITLKQYKRRITGDLKTDDSYVNRELTLTPDLDAIFQSISEGNRQKIDESRTLSAKLDYPCGDADGFYRLLLAHEHRSGIPCPPPAWVQALLGSGMYKVALLFVNGQAAAGTLVKEFKDTISFPYTCLRDTSPASSLAAYRLYWELIRTHAARGAGIFHSGRMPRSEEVPAYRLGWAGTVHQYFYQYWPPSVERTESSMKRGGKRAFLQAMWKHLPRPLAQIIGPQVFKRLP